MSDLELKPCPFCGGKAEIWNARGERTAWIGCMARCSVLVSKEHKTDADAVAAWNTRADAAEITRLRSLLGEARDRLDVIATADVYGNDKEGLQDLIVDIRCSARALIARIGEGET